MKNLNVVICLIIAVISIIAVVFVFRMHDASIAYYSKEILTKPALYIPLHTQKTFWVSLCGLSAFSFLVSAFIITCNNEVKEAELAK